MNCIRETVNLPPAMIRLRQAWSRLSRSWEGQPLQLYAFGKHPAWADFIDVARLPAVPKPFKAIHDRLRAELEQALSTHATQPLFLISNHRRWSLILLVHPTRDRGTPAGAGRQSVLLLGLAIRSDIESAAKFGAPRLAELMRTLVIAQMDADSVIQQIQNAQTAWSAQWATFSTPPAGQKSDSTDALTRTVIEAACSQPSTPCTAICSTAKTIRVENPVARLNSHQFRELLDSLM